jgi:hypothetical protein
MNEASAAWVAQAWQHWHRPWAVTHAAWLDPQHAALAADEAHELTLRLHYLAWCERYALPPTPQAFDDTPWWRLLSLPARRFELAARRVGLALLFAVQPRLRLVRRAQDDAALVRWSLERARFVPEGVAAALRDAMPADTPMEHAALSLHWCLVDEDAGLRARLKLRLAPEHLPLGQAAPRHPDATARASLAALWADGTRTAQTENLT